MKRWYRRRSFSGCFWQCWCATIRHHWCSSGQWYVLPWIVALWHSCGCLVSALKSANGTLTTRWFLVNNIEWIGWCDDLPSCRTFCVVFGIGHRLSDVLRSSCSEQVSRYFFALECADNAGPVRWNVMTSRCWHKVGYQPLIYSTVAHWKYSVLHIDLTIRHKNHFYHLAQNHFLN